ncbi:MAG: iron-containing redox enzyme family protein, partial [Frankiales bacterium]|nr:iron-containing redox enzyme family protein [Frankiales bacterium]
MTTSLLSLASALDSALDTGQLQPLAGTEPADRRDRFLTLLRIYDLHTAPLPVIGEWARYQGHPDIAALKARLEQTWLDELDAEWATVADCFEEDCVEAMKTIAIQDRLPAAYRWLADTADWEQVVEFLALEGGPDGGFDDLVAVCQVGLSGSAKLELGKNYWDEMGTGDLAGVHTALHDRLVEAAGIPRIPREQLPVEALE